MRPHSYRTLLATPAVPRLAVAAALGRMSASMLGLSLLLAVVANRGSYAVAGTLLTVHALALACAAPLLGRLADAAGARRVLRSCLALHAGAYAVLVGAVAGGAGVVVAGAAAAAVGATTPPAGPVTRTQWPRLVAPAALGTAYAFDSALNSATFVVGPVLAGALAAGTTPLAAMVLAGASKVAGDLLLVTVVPRSPGRAAAPVRAGAVRRGAPHGALAGVGPLADALVRRLLVVVSLDTFMHGALQIAAAAIAGAGGSTGLLLGVLAAGEVAGGLAYGARSWPGGVRTHLAVLHLVGTLLLAAVVLASAVPAVMAVYLLLGVASGGRDTVNQLVLGEGAVVAHRTEAFAWLGTSMWAGYGVGTAVAGQIAARGTAGDVHLAAAASALLAALLVRRLPGRASGGAGARRGVDVNQRSRYCCVNSRSRWSVPSGAPHAGHADHTTGPSPEGIPMTTTALRPGGSRQRGSAQPAIEAAGLVKHFGATRAVDGLDLTVPAGTVYGVLGPNGAGKTTTIRMLATLLRPDGGSVRVLGHDVGREARAVRARISLAGQSAAVDEDLTATENLVLLARLQGYARAAARGRAADLLDAFGLTGAADRPARTYSGGMRRRLDLAASIVATPDLIFLDEPTAGLDPRSRSQVWDIIRSLAARGTTVLLTTQYLDEADHLAQRIAVIDRGRVVEEGTPAELKAAVGSGVLRLRLHDADQRPAADQVLTRLLGVPVDAASDPATLSARVSDPGRVTHALDELTRAGIPLVDFALGRPSLDEVFLALTGAPAVHESVAGRGHPSHSFHPTPTEDA